MPSVGFNVVSATLTATAPIAVTAVVGPEPRTRREHRQAVKRKPTALEAFAEEDEDEETDSEKRNGVSVR